MIGERFEKLLRLRKGGYRVEKTDRDVWCSGMCFCWGKKVEREVERETRTAIGKEGKIGENILGQNQYE